MANDEEQKPKYIWKCKCEKFQVKLLGDPLDNINCFCHSCVSPVRYLTEHYPGGTSAATPEGAAAFCLFKLRDQVWPEPTGEKGTPEEHNLGFLKVGDQGKFLRTYTKCCNTQLNMGTGLNFTAIFRPLNRNGVYKVQEDGSLTKYVPETPVSFCGLRWAYDDVDASKVPEPKYNFYPPGFAMRLMGRFVQYLVGMEKEPRLDGVLAIWAKPEDVPAEAVPITWE